jgi:hypothetical protein
VRIILRSVPTRLQAWVHVWLCLLVALMFAIFSLWDWRLLCGVILMLPGAYGYAKALYWVDRHGTWQ